MHDYIQLGIYDAFYRTQVLFTGIFVYILYLASYLFKLTKSNLGRSKVHSFVHS